MNKNNYQINFTEKVSLRSANWLSGLSDDELCYKTWSDDKSDTENKKYLKALRVYLTKIISKDGKLDRHYGNAKGKQFIPGRLYVREGLGLQSCKKNIRSLLTRDIYTDVDMVNCHSCLFLYLAEKSGIEMPNLNDYIKNRQARLDENEVTKHDILALLNKDKPGFQSTPWLNELCDEFGRAREILYIQNNKNYPTDNKWNRKSSVVNQVMCGIETDLIQQAVSLYDKSKIGALCFDGFQLESDQDPKLDELNLIGEPYGIKFAVKEWCQELSVPDAYETPLTYLEKKDEFESSHAMCLNPLCYIKEFEDCHVKYDLGKFSQVIATTGVNLNEWIRDKDARRYDKFDFIPYTPLSKPGAVPVNVYNTFRPFTTPYIKVEDRILKHMGEFYDHILVNVCDNHKEAADWLMMTLAWRVQNPNKLPGAAIVLRGKQGAGKDRTIDIIERIMGVANDYIHRTSEMLDMYGNFNLALKNKLIIQLNEIEGKDGVNYKEKLKDFITTHQNTINEKNLPQYKQRNLALLFVMSNNLTPVVINHGDRRWVLIETGRTNIGNRAYWDSFSALMDDPKWIASVYSNLLDLPLGDFRPDDLARQPETKARKQAKMDNISLVYRWLNQVDWEDKKLFAQSEGKDIIRSNTLKIEVDRFISEYGGKNPGRNAIFKTLRELVGVISTDKQVKQSDGKRPRCAVFDRKRTREELNEMFQYDEDADELVCDVPTGNCWMDNGLD